MSTTPSPTVPSSVPITLSSPSLRLMKASQMVKRTTGCTRTEFSVTPTGKVSGVVLMAAIQRQTCCARRRDQESRQSLAGRLLPPAKAWQSPGSAAGAPLARPPPCVAGHFDCRVQGNNW